MSHYMTDICPEFAIECIANTGKTMFFLPICHDICFYAHNKTYITTGEDYGIDKSEKHVQGIQRADFEAGFSKE